MHRYIIKRLLLMIPVIIGVSLIIFVAMDLAPGNAVDYLAPPDATEEELIALEHELGLDKPLAERYFTYMSGLIRGDLGVSYVSNLNVMEVYLKRLPNTIALAVAALLFAIAVSIPLGIVTAVHNGTLYDNIAMVFALLGLSMPNFWVGLLLIIYLSNGLGWFPSGRFDDGILSLVLPAITLGTGFMANITRTTRSSMLDTLNQDYLRTARAKGVSEKMVIRKHALKNALIPIITAIGTQLGNLMGGSVLTETVFSWPGVGRLIIDSVNARDTPMVTGSIIMTTMLMSVVLLIVDLLYAVVDPRLRSLYAPKKQGGK